MFLPSIQHFPKKGERLVEEARIGSFFEQSLKKVRPSVKTRESGLGKERSGSRDGAD